MSNWSNPGGWRDRAKKANERQEVRDRAADVRAARAAFYEAERLRGEQEAAANAEAVKATLCACPICDAGRVTVGQAELVIRALERLPAGSKADPSVIEHLAAIAQGTVAPGTARAPHLVAGVKRPLQIEVETAPIQAGSYNNGNRLAKNHSFTADGALIDLED